MKKVRKALSNKNGFSYIPVCIFTLIVVNEIINYIKDYRYDAEQIARVMNSDINLIALKISHLIETQRLKLREIEHNSRFLK